MLRDDLRFFVNCYAHAHHLSSVSLSCLSVASPLPIQFPIFCLALLPRAFSYLAELSPENL